MCHHYESVAELEDEALEDLLDSHTEAELEDELTDEELEALTA